jgi:hypothetical protein
MGRILFAACVIFVLLFGAYLVVELVPAEYLGGPDRVRIVSETISHVGSQAWEFGRPIVQLVVVLLILQWILKSAGSHLSALPIRFDDTRALLALIVVVTFSISALAGGPGQSLLKDVALVVIGFYFGALKPENKPTT